MKYAKRKPPRVIKKFKRESSVQFVTNRVHVVLKKRQSKKQNKKEPYGLKLG